MQELYSDNDFKAAEPASATEFSDAFQSYWKARRPKNYRVVDPDLFNSVSKYCRNNGIKPAFFVHAVFNYSVGEDVSPYLFKDPRIIERYMSWADRIPTELLGLDLASPHSVDVHRELETMSNMILTKYGKLEFNELGFKIACADPVFDVTPVSRVILSEAHPIVLRYYGEDYVEWTSRSQWHALVLSDFGLDHEQISIAIENGNTRQPTTDH
jgi:hypothetical protein